MRRPERELLDTDQPDIQELKEILSDIVEEDSTRAGEIIKQLAADADQG